MLLFQRMAPFKICFFFFKGKKESEIYINIKTLFSENIFCLASQTHFLQVKNQFWMVKRLFTDACVLINKFPQAYN